MRLDIRRDGQELVIRMPAPRALAQALIALSWLPFVAIAGVVLWVAGGTFESLSGHGVTGIASGVFFLLFALIILVATLVGLGGSVYGLLGSEVARVSDHTLTLERVLFGARQRQVFENVSGVRLTGPQQQQRWRTPAPTIRFDSDGHGQAFGGGLTEDEAAEVVTAIKEALRA